MDVVIGASGHLGNVVVRELAADSRQVRPIFRSPPLFDLPPGVEPYICDPADGDSLTDALRGAENVFHTAGLISIGINSFKKLYQANVTVTKNVIDACLKAGARRLVSGGCSGSRFGGLPEGGRYSTFKADLPLSSQFRLHLPSRWQCVPTGGLGAMLDWWHHPRQCLQTGRAG